MRFASMWPVRVVEEMKEDPRLRQRFKDKITYMRVFVYDPLVGKPMEWNAAGQDDWPDAMEKILEALEEWSRSYDAKRGEEGQPKSEIRKVELYIRDPLKGKGKTTA